MARRPTINTDETIKKPRKKRKPMTPEQKKANLKLADPSLGSFINDAQRIMEFYSTDGGGEYFKSVWAGLEALAATLEN